MATDLRISNISKIYPGCIANDNVSLQFKSGKIYALLGAVSYTHLTLPTKLEV